MLRLILFLVGIAVVAIGFSWLADRPGQIVFNWEGYEGEITVYYAVVALTFLVGVAILLWSLVRTILTSPATVGNYFYRRRQKRGLDALSSGIIAIGAGDRANAMRCAVQARKSLPNEPLTHLLRAQAAQLAGDKTTTRRIFEAMLAQPDTEQLGLRGLFLEAQREGELIAARQFAERALALNPKLGWSSEALFDLQCKASDWEGALATLAAAKKNGHVEKEIGDRRRAVLLTAQAQKAEDHDSDRALSWALEAHNLAPSLVPAAAIAGRILASRGNTPKAAKVLQKTWMKSPHPDLAEAYSYARVGDSPRDRLDRARQLAGLQQNSVESAIAVARAAIDARAFDVARGALEPFLGERLSRRVATLMARIEAEENGDAGRVREWLARSVNAARDPAWTADGVVSETWAPVSPVTSQLDVFEWRVPVEAPQSTDGGLIADKLAELAARGTSLDAIDAKALTVSAAARPKGEAAAPSEAVPQARSAATSAAVPAAQREKPDSKERSPSQPDAEFTTARASSAADTKPDTRAAHASSSATSLKMSAVTAREVDGVVVKSGEASLVSGKGAIVPVAVGQGAAAKPEAPTVSAGAEVKPAAREATTEVGAAVVKSKPASDQPESSEKVGEPKIFISPRAPDDPGPDENGQEDGEEGVVTLIPRYGTNR